MSDPTNTDDSTNVDSNGGSDKNATQPSAGPTLVWCAFCNGETKPEGKGRCSVCQRFVAGNSASRRHPVDKTRQVKLRDELNEFYRPVTPVLQHTCEQLAGVLERLENTPTGSTSWKRLADVRSSLVAELDASHAATAATTTAPALLRIERVIVYPDPTQFDQHHEPRPTTNDARSIIDTPAPTPVPASPKTCSYGCGSLARCAQIKETRPEAWRALHFLDPEETARRDQEATAVMYHQLGKRSPFL